MKDKNKELEELAKQFRMIKDLHERGPIYFLFPMNPNSSSIVDTFFGLMKEPVSLWVFTDGVHFFVHTKNRYYKTINLTLNTIEDVKKSIFTELEKLKKYKILLKMKDIEKDFDSFDLFNETL